MFRSVLCPSCGQPLAVAKVRAVAWMKVGMPDPPSGVICDTCGARLRVNRIPCTLVTIGLFILGNWGIYRIVRMVELGQLTLHPPWIALPFALPFIAVIFAYYFSAQFLVLKVADRGEDLDISY